MKGWVTIFANTPHDYAFPVGSVPVASAMDEAVLKEIQRLRLECPAWDFFSWSRISDADAEGRHRARSNSVFHEQTKETETDRPKGPGRPSSERRDQEGHSWDTVLLRPRKKQAQPEVPPETTHEGASEPDDTPEEKFKF